MIKQFVLFDMTGKELYRGEYEECRSRRRLLKHFGQGESYEIEEVKQQRRKDSGVKV